MTHSEDHFHDRVWTYLRDSFAAGAIDHEPRLPSGRVPDFVVVPDFGTAYAVEVEDDFEAAFEGVGQAVEYAAELEAELDRPVDPVVALPAGRVEHPEVAYLSTAVQFVEVDHPADDA